MEDWSFRVALAGKGKKAGDLYPWNARPGGPPPAGREPWGVLEEGPSGLTGQNVGGRRPLSPDPCVEGEKGGTGKVEERENAEGRGERRGGCGGPRSGAHRWSGERGSSHPAR